MKTKSRYFLRNLLLFSLSSLIPKLLSMMIVPIYTNCLTTAEYGTAELLSTTASLFIPLFTLDIQDAVMRFSLDYDYPNDQVLSISFQILTIGSLLILGGTIGVSTLRWHGLENSHLCFFFLTYLSMAFNNTISRFCRGIDRVNVLTTGSIINSVVTLGCNLLFLVVFRWGLNGYLLASTLGSIISLVYCFVAAELYRRLTWRCSSAIRRDMLSYSAPLIFSAMAWWFNNALDRYVLSWFCGIEVSGVYAVSFKIPNLFAMLQSVFSQAWSISAVKEYDAEDQDGFISNLYNLMNCSIILICSGLLIFNVPLASLLYSKDFFEAWKYTPPLLLSLVFNAVTLFIGNLFLAVKDTRTLSLSTILGALVNIFCNFMLIPLWGAYGAAIATLFSNITMWLMRRLLLRRHLRLNVRSLRDTVAYGLLIFQTFIACLGWKATSVQLVLLLLIGLLYSAELRGFLQILGEKLRKKL